MQYIYIYILCEYSPYLTNEVVVELLEVSLVVEAVEQSSADILVHQLYSHQPTII